MKIFSIRRINNVLRFFGAKWWCFIKFSALTWMFRNGGDPYCLSGSQTQPYPSNRVIDDPRYMDEYPSPIPRKKRNEKWSWNQFQSSASPTTHFSFYLFLFKSEMDPFSLFWFYLSRFYLLLMLMLVLEGVLGWQ